ncbi:MAG: zinc metallopeptidase, partial [Mucinivorans sp.]
MSPEFLLLIAVAVVGFAVQFKLNSVFKKYSQVMFPGGLTGRDVAERMLRDNGIYDVQVTHVAGQLTDHYNPATKTVNLSDSV